jgi:hypothetical protein
MASPTGTTMARLKIAPQRGHAAALAEIMARHAGHDVILVTIVACPQRLRMASRSPASPEISKAKGAEREVDANRLAKFARQHVAKTSDCG